MDAATKIGRTVKAKIRSNISRLLNRNALVKVVADFKQEKVIAVSRVVIAD